MEKDQDDAVDIALGAGKPEAYRQAIFDSLYRAMRSVGHGLAQFA